MDKLNKVINVVDIVWASIAIIYSSNLAVGRIFGTIPPNVDQTMKAAMLLLVVVIIMHINHQVLGFDKKKDDGKNKQ